MTRKTAALAALLLLVPAPSVATWWALFAEKGPVGQVGFALLKIYVVALPAVWTVLVDRERLRFPRFQRAGMKVAISFALLSGAAILAVYFLFARSLVNVDAFRETLTAAGLESPTHFLVMAAYWTIGNSLVEEYIWRWFVVTRCEVLVPRAAAILLSALFFTAHHFVAGLAFLPMALTLLMCVGVFLGGAMWSWVYARYRNIWAAYLSHAIVDAVVFFVGYDLLFGI